MSNQGKDVAHFEAFATNKYGYILSKCTEGGARTSQNIHILSSSCRTESLTAGSTGFRAFRCSGFSIALACAWEEIANAFASGLPRSAMHSRARKRYHKEIVRRKALFQGFEGPLKGGKAFVFWSGRRRRILKRRRVVCRTKRNQLIILKLKQRGLALFWLFYICPCSFPV